MPDNAYNLILARWQREKLSSPADIDGALYNFRILFAYNSGRIENDKITYSDTREIFENGKLLSYTGDLRTVFEQQNQKDCYEFLKDKIIRKEPLAVALIKDIHRELTKGTYDERRWGNSERPGEFKKRDYVVGMNEVGVPPEEAESALEELCDEMNNAEANAAKTNAAYANLPKTGAAQAANILRAGCYLHAAFENIHPFADGNGRVGRTLTNYYLMTHGHPPVVFYDEDKKDYYAALEAFDASEDLNPLYGFMKAQCVKTWSKAFRIN